MPRVGGNVAYLGVGGVEVPELLSTHLGLKAGEGVVVRTLDPDGPAAAIGVEENDVLLRVAGTAVSGQDELRDAIQAHQSGDEVELDLIHEGKPMKKTVKLGDRPDLPGAIAPQMGPMLEGLPEGQAKRVREAIEQNLRAMEGLRMPDAEQPMPEAMKQLEKRMELMFRGLDFQGGGDGLPGMQFHGSSTIRLQDAEGSVEMQSKDGSKQMRVRDNDGKVEWEGPWDTEMDKAAAPDNIRERIERLNLDVIEDGGNGGLKLQIRPGMMDR
jgi:serine protease Do